MPHLYQIGGKGLPEFPGWQRHQSDGWTRKRPVEISAEAIRRGFNHLLLRVQGRHGTIVFGSKKSPRTGAKEPCDGRSLHGRRTPSG